MKTTTVTMMTVFLVMALSCVIAQEFAIHLLYDRCETLSSKYNELAMRKAQILYVPYSENEPFPAYTPIDPQIDATILAAKNKNPLNIKKLGNGKTREGQIGIDEQGHLIHRKPDLLRVMSRYGSGMELPNELFVNYDVLEKIE